jgi:hypothetical protein
MHKIDEAITIAGRTTATTMCLLSNKNASPSLHKVHDYQTILVQSHICTKKRKIVGKYAENQI